MIQLQNLKKNFGDTEITYPDWEIKKGDHALILGTSGSGKTTLLHLITGLLQASEGKVHLDGQDLAQMSTGELDKYRGENVGIVFQKPHLVASLTVSQNIMLGSRFNRSKVSKKRLDEVMDSLGILNLRDRKVYQISEGQAQRVSMARAVIHGPKLIAADEPTASLDDASCDQVLKLLKDQAANHDATLLIATHDQRVKEEFSNRLEL